jgi:hypothetical protein
MKDAGVALPPSSHLYFIGLQRQEKLS